MRQVIITIAAVILTAGTICEVARGKTIYVDADAAGPNTGTTWADAYNFLQDALADANSSQKPVEIRVAQGVYKPDRSAAEPNGTGDREATFRLISGVTLKGGYAGSGEPDPNARDIALYETILSGDLLGDDNDVPASSIWTGFADNCYHVVTGSGTDQSALMDSFVITRGSAMSSESMPYPFDPNKCGGGMFISNGSATIKNCTFTRNIASYGGGMYALFSNPVLVKCIFSENVSYPTTGGYSGGGMVNDQSGGSLDGCSFVRNITRGSGGGMMNCKGSNPMVANCTFTANSADGTGGGMYNDGSNPTFVNCTFTENTAGFGGGAIVSGGSSPRITNCVISGNSGAHMGGGILVWGCGDEPVISDCIIRGNRAWQGAGICESSCGGGGSVHLRISRCVIAGNQAEGDGGGISCNPWTGIIEGCIITGNAARWGGGIHSYSFELELRSCTFSGNIAKDPGGGAYQGRAATLRDSILWGDVPKEIDTGSNPPEVVYCDVEGGWPGEGNINADPCFAEAGYWDPNQTPDDANDDFWVDGDYHLKSQAGRWNPNGGQWTIDEVTSSCIDAGDPMSPIGYEQFPNGGIINMGAHGGTAEASKSYFGKRACEVIVAGDVNGDCRVDYLDAALMFGNWLDTRALVAAYPNPPDGAFGIRTRPVLSWQAGIGATSHDVYFGTSSPGTFQRNQTETTFTPGRLSELTRYYWRIDEVSARGKTIGNVWQFATTIDGGTR